MIRREESTPAIAAAGAVLVIAVLAGAGLWWLWAMYRESLHIAAARTVMDTGRMMARQLADQPAVRLTAESPRDWEAFSRLVRSLNRVQKGLQYVSVTEAGVILFHEDLAEEVPESVAEDEDVRVERRIVERGRAMIPVLTFTAVRARGLQPSRSVQVAIRKDAVAEEEQTAAEALGAMVRLAFVTMAAGFGLSAGLVLWILHMEIGRLRRRREIERLAFAGALTNGIIHDLRNPLSSLKLDVQMLRREATQPGGGRAERLAELAERAGRTMDRLDAVLKEFLLVAKPDSRERESVEINACVQDCLDMLHGRFEQSGVRTRMELAPTPLVVDGYPVALKRAFLNVITNAKQASPTGGTVTIRTAAEAGWVIVEVLDEGPGIPPKDRERVFDWFASKKPGGTGLGLSLARAAIESCGGSIRVGESPEGGARVTIKLPRRGDGGKRDTKA